MALSKRILSIAQEIYNNNDEDFLFSILWTSSSYKDFSSNFIFCRAGKDDDTFVGREIVKLLGVNHNINFRSKEELAYYDNPKYCLKCGCLIQYKKRSNAFCSSSCSASYSNERRLVTDEHKRNISIGIQNYYLSKGEAFIERNINGVIKKVFGNERFNICKSCGSFRGECKRPDICKHYGLFEKLVNFFGFDKTAIGTERVIEEYEKCKDILYKEYWENNLSSFEIDRKYSCLFSRKVLKSMGIPLRNRGEALALGVYLGKISTPNISNKNFKSGYFETWKGKRVFLRSSLEFEFATKLNELKCNFEVESLRIKYFDSLRNKNRTAIPDFYMPDTNEIFELKGYRWDDEEVKQNMRDKFLAYKEQGYIPHLILKNNVEILDF